MKHLYVVNFKLLPHVRRELRDGISYVVAPVVAVHAGVLNGQLLPAEEISKSIAAWNGVPLPIGHPREDGQFISVNREDLLAQCIGTFRNPNFDGFSLRGELWLNEGKARTLGGDALAALERIEKGEQLEVSTAYTVKSPDSTQGVYNGQAYDGIQRDIQPDHLALLPNEIGACSWQDGCGAPRVNTKKESSVKNFLAAMKTRLFGQVQANIEQSFDDVRHALWEAVNKVEDMNEHGMGPSCYIEDVYPERVIYSLSDQLYERSYTLDGNGKATLGDRSAVVKEVRYLPMAEPAANAVLSPANAGLSQAPSAPTTNETHCDCPHTSEQHANQEVQMDKKELVTNVLKAHGLAESERAKFEALPDAVLQKLATNAETTPAPAPTPQQPQPAVSAHSPTPAVPQTNSDVLHLFKQFEGMAATRRERLTEQITANTDFTKEQCTVMSLEQLDQLARNIMPQANYGGRVFPHLAANEAESVPEMPNLFAPTPAGQSH